MKLNKLILLFLLLLLIVEIVVIAPERIDEKKMLPRASSVNVPSHFVSQREEVKNKDDLNIEQVMSGAHLVEARDGDKEWELWAERAMAYKQSASWVLKKVKTQFFGKSGVFFVVTGDEGSVDVKTKDMHIKGKVKIVSSNGYVFQTNEMVYRSVQRQIESPTAVSMWGPKDTAGYSLSLHGKSLLAELTNSLMTVNREVKGEKIFPGNRRLMIRSQKAVFSGKTNLARFIGDVVMDVETMRITGPEALFEYGKDSDMVKSVHVSGGVRVSDLDKWATSQNVSMNFDKDRYVFRGNPRLVQNNDELLGEEIIFLNGGKKVEVYKARARVDDSHLEKIN